MGLWGFRTEQKDKLKNIVVLSVGSSRGERERERVKQGKKKKNDREERGERENLSCLSLLL